MTYEIGFKKPPKEKQFKPGICPNPRGRGARRDNKSEAEIMNDILYSEVAYVENGKKKRAPLLQLIITRYAMAAAKGEPSAARMLKIQNHFAVHGDIVPMIIWRLDEFEKDY